MADLLLTALGDEALRDALLEACRDRDFLFFVLLAIRRGEKDFSIQKQT